MDIPCGIFLVLEPCRSGKTALHPSASLFLLILGADDTALLTQGKEDKAKSGEKGRRGADRVQFPYA